MVVPMTKGAAVIEQQDVHPFDRVIAALEARRGRITFTTPGQVNFVHFTTGSRRRHDQPDLQCLSDLEREGEPQ